MFLKRAMSINQAVACSDEIKSLQHGTYNHVAKLQINLANNVLVHYSKKENKDIILSYSRAVEYITVMH